MMKLLKNVVYLLAIALGMPADLTGMDKQFNEPANAKQTRDASHRWDAVVAADGSAEFKNVQAAIDAAPSNRTSYYRIYIKKGVYKEVITVPADKPYIHLVGENADKTILTYDNYAKRLDRNGKEYGTSGSASFFVKGSSFMAEKLTFANTAGITAGQALAINITSALSAFRDCRFLGHQDTWFAASGTKQYLKDCYIEGSVDFIFGGSTAYFETCELRSTRAGYITAASTPANQQYGYVFDRCKLTAVGTVGEQSVYLGRPWRPNAKVVYLNCEMGEHIKAEGWDNWRNQANEKTAFYAEYQSRGPGYQNGKRVLWSHQLNEDEAGRYKLEQVLGEWFETVINRMNGVA